MARDVVHDASQPLALPDSVSPPEGVDATAVLARLAAPLPFEAGYSRSRYWRSFQPLSGVFDFTWSADALVVPTGVTVRIGKVFVFARARANTTPAIAGADVRPLYGVAPADMPTGRTQTLVLDGEEGLTASIDFGSGLPVAGVRAALTIDLE